MPCEYSVSHSSDALNPRLSDVPLHSLRSRSHDRLASEGVHVDDDLYMSTNSSSRYQHDPEYGGKLSLSGWKEAKAGAPQAPQPTPPMPPDHPRVRELAGAETASGCAAAQS